MKDFKNFSRWSAENEIRTLNILIEMDKEYKMLQKLDPVEKSKREIKDRVRHGVYGKNKDKLNEIKDALFKVICEFLVKNPEHSRCPFEVYAKTLQNAGIPGTDLFRTIVKNDGALERWRKKAGEWENFSQSSAVNRVNYLENMIKEYDDYKNNQDSKKKVNIFDGDLGI